MKKRNLFLLIWIGSLVLLVVFGAVANTFKQESAGYTAFGALGLIALISFIVFLVMWKKTCPSCKNGKMIYTHNEDGESFVSDRNVTKSSDIKDRKGNLVGTVETTEEQSYLVTPSYKIYECNKCGHTIQKLDKKNIKSERL
ncbi:MAG: hypothetical protein ACOX56_07155 [Acholeplasmataceae bacterium]|jgi:Zn ribbon nucleic-acid-binding protein